MKIAIIKEDPQDGASIEVAVLPETLKREDLELYMLGRYGIDLESTRYIVSEEDDIPVYLIGEAIPSTSI